MRPGQRLLVAVLALITGPTGSGASVAGDFVHFESSHVHPIALSPNGRFLYAVNTPEGRLAILRTRRRLVPVWSTTVEVRVDRDLDPGIRIPRHRQGVRIARDARNDR